MGEGEGYLVVYNCFLKKKMLKLSVLNNTLVHVTYACWRWHCNSVYSLVEICLLLVYFTWSNPILLIWFYIALLLFRQTTDTSSFVWGIWELCICIVPCSSKIKCTGQGWGRASCTCWGYKEKYYLCSIHEGPLRPGRYQIEGYPTNLWRS